jgi:hypothetical protein
MTRRVDCRLIFRNEVVGTVGPFTSEAQRLQTGLAAGEIDATWLLVSRPNYATAPSALAGFSAKLNSNAAPMRQSMTCPPRPGP